jgi:hypothetical protein
MNSFKSTLVINVAVCLVLILLGLFAFKYTFDNLFVSSLAVKEFNSKTNICFTTTILFLKESFGCMPGLYFYVSIY